MPLYFGAKIKRMIHSGMNRRLRRLVLRRGPLVCILQQHPASQLAASASRGPRRCRCTITRCMARRAPSQVVQRHDGCLADGRHGGELGSADAAAIPDGGRARAVRCQCLPRVALSSTACSQGVFIVKNGPVLSLVTLPHCMSQCPRFAVNLLRGRPP